MLIEPTFRTEIYLLLCKGSTGTNVSNALQTYTVKLQWKLDTCKKCTLYKYICGIYSPMIRKAKLRQPAGQRLSNVRMQHHVLPLRTIYFRSYQYETPCRRNAFVTHVKSVKTTLNIFAVWLKTTFGPLHLFKLWDVYADESRDLSQAEKKRTVIIASILIKPWKLSHSQIDNYIFSLKMRICQPTAQKLNKWNPTIFEYNRLGRWVNGTNN